MPTNEISSPTVAAPVDRMSLGVASVRHLAAGVDVTVNPSSCEGEGRCTCYCFEGSDE